MDSNLPIINLELNSGVFRIKTPDAIYNITVTQDSSITKVVEKVVEREVLRQEEPKTASGPSSDLDDLFYREISEEMYDEIGKLARQLSLSIQEIPGPTLKGVDIKKTGIELEDAKGQLEDIVQMTEKATMDIMDLAETIQEDLQEVESTLGSLKEMEFMSLGEMEKDLDWGDDVFNEPEPVDKAEITPEFLGMIIDTETQLKEIIQQLPASDEQAAVVAVAPQAPAAPPEPRLEKITRYEFDVDVVFQTLYELCTNETVKSHIKAMRTEQKTSFDQQAVGQFLAELAPNVDVEDNFFNFPITSILKGLHDATGSEKYKQVLKKMNQTAANIFLDAVLPVEGSTVEEEIELPAEEPDPPAAPLAEENLTPSQSISPDTIQTLLSLVDENIGRLEAEKKRLEEGSDQEQPSSLDPDFTQVRNEDREAIIHSVDGTDKIVRRITSHLTGIMEALSFQDLSGQRIFKIVRLISDVQIQLLSLLISFGSKIKQKKEEQTATIQDADKLAQDEVDKMMEKISQAASSTMELAGPDGEGRLDQNEVDKMLANLGF